MQPFLSCSPVFPQSGFSRVVWRIAAGTVARAAWTTARTAAGTAAQQFVERGARRFADAQTR
eukprot:3816225-Lingulodinium_polyedra.AAC.1